MLKKHISTSIWSGQYPNAGQNIQQIMLFLPNFFPHFWIKILKKRAKNREKEDFDQHLEYASPKRWS